MYWGGLSDKIGRKPVLLLGCAGTLLSLIVVGFSSTFAMALLGRVLGGILNGNIGVIQTMVGELVTRPEHERKFGRFIWSAVIANIATAKAYAVMPFVWSVGTIVGRKYNPSFTTRSAPCTAFATPQQHSAQSC